MKKKSNPTLNAFEFNAKDVLYKTSETVDDKTIEVICVAEKSSDTPPTITKVIYIFVNGKKAGLFLADETNRKIKKQVDTIFNTAKKKYATQGEQNGETNSVI